MYYHLFCVVFFLFSLSAGAGLLGEPSKEDGAFWRVHFQLERFLREDYDLSKSLHFLFAHPDLLYFGGFSADVHNAHWDISSRYNYSAREDYHYLRNYELAFKVPREDGQWAIGRYRLEWDWSDHFWNRGLWEPFYREDALRARQGGLTGVFRQFHYDHVEVTLFASPVFIPESGPHFMEQKGRLVSENPWFVSPSNSKIGFTNIVPAYQLASTSWQDAMQFSFAGRMSYKALYMAYAYKPINNVPVKSSLNLDLSKPLQGSHEEGYATPIRLEPVFLKHHLAVVGWNAEKAYDSATGLQNIYALKMNITYHHPEKLESKKPDTVFFQPKKEWHFSAHGELEVQDTREETVLYVAYTYRFFGRDEEKKTLLSKVFPQSDEQQFFRNDLFQFTHAASAGIHHALKWTDTQSTDIKTRLIYHFEKQYFLFSAELSLHFHPFVSLFVASDILFTGFPFDIWQLTQDIGVYKNKSRVFGGIQYVF